MNGSFAVFAPAWDFIGAKLNVFLGERLGYVIAAVSGPLRAALVLYVVLYGLAILRGAIAEPIMDVALRSLKLSFIYLIATTPAYSTFVTEPLFHGLPHTLAQAITGSDLANIGTAFDALLAHAMWLAESIAVGIAPFDITRWVMTAAVFVVGALTAAIGFAVVILAKVALALLIALGPIFVACALFEATRRFFFGWLSQAVNYLVLFTLIITVVELVLSLIADQWATIETAAPMAGGLIFMMLSLLAAIFFLQVPAIAAGIAGGASAGLADFANAVTFRDRKPERRADGPDEAARRTPGGGSVVREPAEASR